MADDKKTTNAPKAEKPSLVKAQASAIQQLRAALLAPVKEHSARRDQKGRTR